MPTGNAGLIEFIREIIRTQGPQSFAWLMQQALYHPKYGYYSSGRAVIGRKGDYFTNVSIGPFFGELLAAQFVEIWQNLGRRDNFVIVEQGAHDGQFARDVLEAIQRRSPDFLSAMRYRIVEPFSVWRARQRQTLEAFRDKVEWRDALEPFTGIHFSNELLDAMPVRLFESGVEKVVDVRGDEFVFVAREAAGHDLSANDSVFNQAALDWIDNVAANLERGYVIAVDYGHTNGGAPAMVQVRAQHRYLDSPFEQIGQADITAHVDWTSIVERASMAGFDLAGFTDQHHFLTGLLASRPDFPSEPDLDRKAKRELQTLLHPEMMGRSFQTLALSKNVDPGLRLAGFKFARNISPSTFRLHS